MGQEKEQQRNVVQPTDTVSGAVAVKIEMDDSFSALQETDFLNEASALVTVNRFQFVLEFSSVPI